MDEPTNALPDGDILAMNSHTIIWDCPDPDCMTRNMPIVRSGEILDGFVRLTCVNCGHVEYIDTNRPDPVDSFGI